MNTRIKELHERAWRSSMYREGDIFLADAFAGINWAFFEDYDKQYAEMIIRECVKRTKELGQPEIGSGILKHFGMENKQMNERIMEIAWQCGFTIDPDIYYCNLSFDLNKFAEEIIKECIAMARIEELADDAELGYNDGISDAVAAIKQHFGVEVKGE